MRADSDCRDEGDRERRSKRDGRRGSGSVWSKRERLARRLSSAMMEKESDQKAIVHNMDRGKGDGVENCRETEKGFGGVLEMISPADTNDFNVWSNPVCTYRRR